MLTLRRILCLQTASTGNFNGKRKLWPSKGYHSAWHLHFECSQKNRYHPDSKVRVANMGPTRGRQDPRWPRESCHQGSNGSAEESRCEDSNLARRHVADTSATADVCHTNKTKAWMFQRLGFQINQTEYVLGPINLKKICNTQASKATQYSRWSCLPMEIIDKSRKNAKSYFEWSQQEIEPMWLVKWHQQWEQSYQLCCNISTFRDWKQ